MNLFDYLKPLKDKVFSNDTMLAELKANIVNLETLMLPTVAVLIHMEKEKPKLSKTSTTLLRLIKPSKRYVGGTLEVYLPNVIANAKFLESEYNKVFTKDETVVNGVGSKKAIFMANTGMLSSFTYYGMTLVDVLGREYAADESKMRKDIYDVEAYEYDYLAENRYDFVQAMNTLSVDPKKFAKAFKKQIDIKLDEHAEEYGGMEGLPDIKVKQGFLGNLIYILGSPVVEWQASRYKSMKAKKESLDLLLLDLQNSKDGKNNAAIEQQIEYHRKRILKLEDAIADYEED